MAQRRISRRDFLEFGVTTVAVSACTGCSIFGSRKPDTVVQEEAGVLRLDQAMSSTLLGSDTSLLVEAKNSGDKIIIVHRVNGELYATSAVCTHMGCDVKYDVELGHLLCPCHGSQYGLDGSNIKGPSTKPLKRYRIGTENGLVVITL